MGEREEWAQPSGLLPNGLVPDETSSVIRSLDGARWSKAEQRTAELISCIKPNPLSDGRRKAVVDYVERLIKECFQCQVKVFTFGSVPLKTYLPDGDIDLSAFSEDQNLKDSWALKVRDILQKEEQNVNAEFRVKEVQYIQAEVKIIKCLVENIVVDISFNQLGGLCTLCFLEAVDHLINQNYLFKRSIILIKAWCYYESRILGAHHGLISTYALEILVLYIFHVFNNTFAGPLEVLYRFLEFFSNFDWDNFCVSLWGPVPVSSLPDITAEPPRKDSGKLVLSKLLLEACSTFYFVDNQGPSFVSKHFNVIDPLRVNNNLGRSVSKGNFFRIRSAFAFGAKRLQQLLDCSNEDIIFELDQFFMNTWERHGNGNRPDAPTSDLHQVRSSNPHCVREHDDNGNTSSQRKQQQPSGHELVVEGSQSSNTCLTHCSSSPLESKSMTNDISSVSHAPPLKVHTNVNSLRVSSRSERGNPNHGSQADKSQRSLKPSTIVNEQIPGKHLFTRTRSSPDLTETYGDSSGRARQSKVVDLVNHQIYAMRTDNRRRKDIASETISSQSNRLSSDDSASRKKTSSQQQIDVAVDSDSASNYHPDDSSVGGSMREEHVTVGVHGMQQAEQDLVNMMSSMSNFGGQVPMPLNLASTRPPLSFSPSMMASLFYAQRNFAGMVPGNIPLVEPPWGPNLQLPQSLISSPLTQYFPGIGLKSNMEDTTQQVTEKYVSAEMVHEESHNEWDRRDEKSSGRYASGDGSLEIHDSDDRQPSTSGDSSFTQPYRFGGSGSFARTPSKLNRENRGSARDEQAESIHLQDNRAGEAYSDDGSDKVVSSISQASLLRSKSSSGSSLDGSSLRPSKSTRERRGKRTTASSAVVPSTVYGKGRSTSEHNSSQETDDESKDRNSNTTDPEIVERSTLTQPEAIVHPFRTHLSGYDTAQTSGSDSLVPMNPMLLGPGSRPSITDNSGMLPLTFYPTGPPVPFLTMLPVYNFPTNGGSSDASTSHLSREEGVEHSNLNQSLESCSRLSDTGDLNMSSSIGRMSTTGEQLDEPKDILHSDFVSHWQNLQYGRICQKPRYHVPVVYPSPVVVPPIYLQGRMPWDGPGRPNVNLFSPIMNYGPRILPVAPLQPISNRTPAGYQHYVDDLPRRRGGTGTYLPNLKTRDKHSSGTRRNSYNFDRNDNHADREGNWNAAKSRSMWRSQHRNQTGKSSSRLDDSSASGSRADRPWSSHRHEPSLPSYYAQNGPVRPNSSQGASASISYGMYPVPGMNPNGLSANGPNDPPVVMLYQYDHNSGYVPHSEPLEFGSVGPVGYMSSNEGPPLPEGTQTRGPFEEQRFHGSSQLSSPDQPSSPHVQKHFIF